MKAHRAITGVLVLVVGGCSSGPEQTETARRVIGPGGGLISSLDSVLTIAIPPGALEVEEEFFIERTDDPPDVFGEAYVVLPNPELSFDITVTYRRDLPSDTSAIAVGSIDALSYEEGRGHWVPLEVMRIDPEQKLVSGVDTRVSIFYGLLDDVTQSSTTDNAGSSDGGLGAGEIALIEEWILDGAEP